MSSISRSTCATDCRGEGPLLVSVTREGPEQDVNLLPNPAHLDIDQGARCDRGRATIESPPPPPTPPPPTHPHPSLNGHSTTSPAMLTLTTKLLPPPPNWIHVAVTRKVWIKIPLAHQTFTGPIPTLYTRLNVWRLAYLGFAEQVLTMRWSLTSPAGRWMLVGDCWKVVELFPKLCSPQVVFSPSCVLPKLSSPQVSCAIKNQS